MYFSDLDSVLGKRSKTRRNFRSSFKGSITYQPSVWRDPANYFLINLAWVEPKDTEKRVQIFQLKDAIVVVIRIQAAVKSFLRQAFLESKDCLYSPLLTNKIVSWADTDRCQII